MSIPPTSSYYYGSYANPAKFSGTSSHAYFGYQPSDPSYTYRTDTQKPQSNGYFWTKVLIGGLVIGGGSAFLLHKVSPGTLQKFQETVKPFFSKTVEPLLSAVDKVIPDWLKSGISDAGTHVQNLFKKYSENYSIPESASQLWNKTADAAKTAFEKFSKKAA
jgi:hypothetical protein